MSRSITKYEVFTTTADITPVIDDGHLVGTDIHHPSGYVIRRMDIDFGAAAGGTFLLELQTEHGFVPVLTQTIAGQWFHNSDIKIVAGAKERIRLTVTADTPGSQSLRAAVYVTTPENSQ
jgi:hypothetical protein